VISSNLVRLQLPCCRGHLFQRWPSFVSWGSLSYWKQSWMLLGLGCLGPFLRGECCRGGTLGHHLLVDFHGVDPIHWGYEIQEFLVWLQLTWERLPCRCFALQCKLRQNWSIQLLLVRHYSISINSLRFSGIQKVVLVRKHWVLLGDFESLE